MNFQILLRLQLHKLSPKIVFRCCFIKHLHSLLHIALQGGRWEFFSVREIKFSLWNYKNAVKTVYAALLKVMNIIMNERMTHCPRSGYQLCEIFIRLLRFFLQIPVTDSFNFSDSKLASYNEVVERVDKICDVWTRKSTTQIQTIKLWH